MPDINNLPGGVATSLNSSDKIYVAQGSNDRSATIAQVGVALGTNISTVANVLNYGAIGDGSLHPLSQRYGNLAAAQVDYPFATALTQQIDWAAIQKALTAMAARGDKGGRVVVPNAGFSYRINETLTINPARVSLIGEGTTLDFSGIAYGKKGFNFNADTSAQYGHRKQRMQGFEIIGPGRNSGQLATAAFYFKTNVDLLSSRYMIADCAVHDWPRGIYFDDRSYADSFHSCEFYSCDEAIYFGGVNDAGEMYSFSQSSFFNCGLCINNAGGAGMFFFGCSLDYCNKMYVGTGEVRLLGCHIEHSPTPGQNMWDVQWNSLSFIGCWYLVTGGPLTTAAFTVASGHRILWEGGRASGLGSSLFSGSGVFAYGAWTQPAAGTMPSDNIIGLP